MNSSAPTRDAPVGDALTKARPDSCRLIIMVDDGILAAIGATIVGFGIVAFMFRVQRELETRQPRRLLDWIPWADLFWIGDRAGWKGPQSEAHAVI